MFAHEQQARDIEHAREMSRTRYFWWVNYLTDYAQHDFLWEPVPWQATQTHVWPSQWQQNGGTALVPKTAGTDINYDHAVLPRNRSVPKVGIDHGNGLTVECEYHTRYISDYLGTLKRILSRVKEPYVWVISSVCDYNNFDFSWHPSEWQDRMLHVFASEDQKFGDTFYVHVPSFLQKTANLELLEWFDTIHFVENLSVPRRPVPIIYHDYDTQVEAVWNHEFQTPVAQFVCSTGAVGERVVPVMNLWRTETKNIMPLSPGASTVLVPREAKNSIENQLYDYAFIDKTHNRLAYDQLLDIVFIDNGEPNADQHWFQLLHATNQNRIHRSSGVTGRVAAYQAAARLSTTPWFFAVFAKLEIDKSFDWSWQPDRLQRPKHYIFHARNPVNNLVYGHQAIIAYNRNLVLSNTGFGLDFTLDQAHEVVPVVCGIAHYNATPWMAWRTAFRECIKLRHSLPDVENQYRLNQWLTVGNGKNALYSCQGAEDAIEYYEQVHGNLAELKKSYDWAWLASYAFLKRNLTPGQ